MGEMTNTELLRRIYNTLDFYANETSYVGERTGGVLAGCPRKPDPKPHELVEHARRTLEYVKQLYAVLSTPPAPSVPEGWKLVPVVPTQAMKDAGKNACWDNRYVSAYVAMLSAAPSPPTTEGVHPATADLVRRFSAALLEKLAAAERKYGYTDGWTRGDWMDECRAHLRQHIDKGDPRDVAAYCAFLWHHNESTAQPVGERAQAVAYRWRWLYKDDKTWTLWANMPLDRITARALECGQVDVEYAYTSPPTEQCKVDDAMVERAEQAFWLCGGVSHEDAMRAALLVALGQGGGT